MFRLLLNNTRTSCLITLANVYMLALFCHLISYTKWNSIEIKIIIINKLDSIRSFNELIAV
jgi:hypothetical protein